jgi:flagellar basal body rod protein FlgG
MFLNPAMSAALDRIAERAADVRRAFTPGAVPQHDDVATRGARSDFTLDPLSVAPPDGAYFVTRDERDGNAYTRDGSFSLRGGRLVDGDGRPVYGIDSTGALTELRVDPVDDTLGRIADARIERDGRLIYRRELVDPRSGARESESISVGRIALARFPAGTRLVAADGDHCVPPAGVEPQIGVAGEGSFASLSPMRRERSRIDIDESLVRLKDAYIAFDALQAAQTAKSHFGKTAMDLVK